MTHVESIIHPDRNGLGATSTKLGLYFEKQKLIDAKCYQRVALARVRIEEILFGLVELSVLCQCHVEANHP